MGSPAQPTFLHFPITDMTAPSMSYLAEIVDTVQEQLDRGDTVYMHCWGGRGRSGTIGAALMWPVFSATDTPEQLLERLQRSFNNRGKPGTSPETEDQVDMVLAYINSHIARGSGSLGSSRSGSGSARGEPDLGVLHQGP